MARSPFESLFATLPDFILSDVQQVATVNADVEGWPWTGTRRDDWTLAAPEWLSFAKRWREASEEMLFNTRDEHGSRVLNFCDPDEQSDLIPAPVRKILVRDCYLEAVKTLWIAAARTWGLQGVVLKGPPGSGNTVFIWFLLVCLLQMKQMVAFKPSSEGPVILFHPDGSVYTGRSARCCPHPRRREDGSFIWSLIDIGVNTSEDMTSVPLFPVQALSSHSNREFSWWEKRMAVQTELSPWTRDELIRGIRFDRFFLRFQADLAMVVSTWNQQPPPDFEVFEFRYPGILKLLRTCYTNGCPPSVDEACITVLDALIALCGHVPRDVYCGIHNYSGILSDHEAQG